MSVAEIGYPLGFADPAHFSRFFKRMAGMAPFRALQPAGLIRPVPSSVHGGLDEPSPSH
ncbi:helix-turn-helix domain-containing protein [Sphingomonas sp. FW199]|uniref:helix-turn-helix domain-containing protein n=1 Tax=Sphingomonas sp. FW199 TaxID=3400217 RepID=UPI003CF164E7